METTTIAKKGKRCVGEEVFREWDASRYGLPATGVIFNSKTEEVNADPKNANDDGDDGENKEKMKM